MIPAVKNKFRVQGHISISFKGHSEHDYDLSLQLGFCLWTYIYPHFHILLLLVVLGKSWRYTGVHLLNELRTVQQMLHNHKRAGGSLGAAPPPKKNRILKTRPRVFYLFVCLFLFYCLYLFNFVAWISSRLGPFLFCYYLFLRTFILSFYFFFRLSSPGPLQKHFRGDSTAPPLEKNIGLITPLSTTDIIVLQCLCRTCFSWLCPITSSIELALNQIWY